MANEKIPDHVTDFSYGQDARFAPDRIALNAYASGNNISTRNGRISPRHGYKELILDFSEAGTYVDSKGRTKSAEELYSLGNFQAALKYRIGEENYLIEVVSGIIYLISLETGKVTQLDVNNKGRIPDYGLSPNQVRVNWTYANTYSMLFDSGNTPVILKDFTARRSEDYTPNSLIARMGSYNHNRVFIVNLANEYTAGDPVGNRAAPYAPISFTEVLQQGTAYFAQVFQLNTDYQNEPIRAIGFVPLTDTTTGVGPMFLATDRQIFTSQTHNPRPTWEQTTFTTLIVNNKGMAGQRAFVAVGSDVFFISPDYEISSLSMSSAEQRKYARVPISREIDNWTKTHSKELSRYAFCSYFDNKLYFSVKPKRIETKSKDGYSIVDYAFSGLAVLELDNLSGFGVDSKPAWAGIHTGLDYQDMVVVEEKAYIFAKVSGRNSIFQITPESTVDYFKGVPRQIRSRVYTREHTFVAASNAGQIASTWDKKELTGLDVSLKQLSGKVKFSAYYKPEEGVVYEPYGTYQHVANADSCGKDAYRQYALQDVGLVSLGSPTSEVCNELSDSKYNVSSKFQFRFDIVGDHWEIDGYKATAKVLPDDNSVSCESKELTINQTCTTDLSLYKDSSFDHKKD